MAYGFNDDKSKFDIEDILENIINTIYPVGSIYMSVRNTNPSTLFGGTWVAWGQGRVPVGVNASETEFNAVEKTGGEKKHKLTGDETGQKAVTVDNVGTIHTQIRDNNPVSAGIGVYVAGVGAYGSLRYVQGLPAHGHGENIDLNQKGIYTTKPSISKSDASTAHNILQPYITCYMWKRTA